MPHSNNDLRYRVVLVSESSSSPPAVSPPSSGGEPASTPPETPLSYTAVPVEETYSKPAPPATPVPSASAPSSEPVYEVLPVAHTAPLYDHRGFIRRRRRRRLPWTLEKHGLETLAYPFRDMAALGWLIGGLGLGTAIGATLLVLFTSANPEGIFFLLLWAGFPVYVLCFVGGYFECVLTSGVVGEAGKVRWPGLNVKLVVQGCGRCLWCFLTGPIVPLAAAVYFWLNVGEFTRIDWWIMAELVFVAAAYWLFSFLAVVENDSIRHAKPSSVFQTMRQLGWYALWAAFLMFFWAVLYGIWALDAMRELHRFIGSGWLWLWFCSIFAVLSMTWLLRWLGITSYRCRTRNARVENAQPLWTPHLPPASL